MGRLLIFPLLIFSALSSLAQGTFTRVFGGPQDEHALALTPTRDGGYAIAGFTFSEGNGMSDIWVMKVDAYGQEQWRQLFGDDGYEWANDLVETRDGNLVIAGYQRDRETGLRNAWVFQVNRHGDLMWSKVYGGEEGDEAKALTQTNDGGFAVVGYSHSFSKGKSDVWLLRLNAVGEELWQKHYGTREAEKGYSISETHDEGFIIGGFQFAGEANKADMLAVRLDRNGEGIWRKVFRETGNGVIESILETPQGNILAAGWGFEDGAGLQGRLLELTPGGRLINDQHFGQLGKDVIYDLEPVSQGGYIAVGQSDTGNEADVWLIRLNEEGMAIWETRTKGEGEDYGHAVTPTADGGYVIAGGSESLGQGGSDICLFKTDRMGRFDSSIEFETQQAQPVVRTDGDFGNGPVKPDLYVLSVGVSEYQDEEFRLNFAHQDAQQVAEKFEQQTGALFRNVETKVLTNEEATLVNIKQGLAWLERQATQKDLIVMFFSTHGALDHKGSHYLLPTDFDPHNLFATGLNIRDLTEGVDATPCKKLIFLDACHSGQSGFDFMEFATIKALDLNQAVEDLIAREPGLTVITSSSGREFSYERPEWGHGAFSKALLEGLNGSADVNTDQVVTLAELNFYIIERVRDLTQGRQHPYMPINLFGNIPLFVLPD